MIRVRFAREDDVDAVVEFLRAHWSADHLFVARPDVFRWQHLQSDGRLNMVIAEQVDGRASTVLGALGFIPFGRFSESLDDRDVMLAIWKVAEGAAPPGLGLRLLKYLQAELEPGLIGAIGTSKMVRRIYQTLRFEVGTMKHAALFNPARKGSLRIADAVPDDAFRAIEDGGVDMRLVPMDDGDEYASRVDALADVTAPRKNWEYIVNRYLRHPWYSYDVRAVIVGDRLAGVVVWRVVNAPNGTVLRIVDVIGDPAWIRHGGRVLRSEVGLADAEYVDLVHWGVDDEILEQAGFVSTAAHPSMVVPNYFSPFERRSVEVDFAYKLLDGRDAPVRLFRADSDQDRPNQVVELRFAR